jgi:asparagine synthase (glutamine-hydrolysing)
MSTPSHEAPTATAFHLRFIRRDDGQIRIEGDTDAWPQMSSGGPGSGALQLSLPGGCDVLLDRGRGSVTVSLPGIAVEQLYWRCSPDRLEIAASAQALTADQVRRLDPQALYAYVYFHEIPSPACIFEGIGKLPPGHTLSWDGRHADVARQWQPTFADESRVTEREAADELLRLLLAAVRRSMPGRGTVGCFLSGGLDSSTVAGLAAQVHPGIATVSMGFDAQGYDEMEYARIAARHFATHPIEYYVTPDDVLRTLPDVAAGFSEPFGNSSAAAVYQCARVARDHGIEVMLAGDGGDELFGGNERYARQLVFERYARIPALLRNVFIETPVAAAARMTRRYPIGKAESYIAQASVPLPDRLQAYNFLHRHSPDEVFTPALVARVDRSSPLAQLRDEYRAPATSSAVNRMLFLDWKFTLHDNDLVKVNTMCRMHGVAVSYPMLDQELVDFSLRIPGDWKVRSGELRWFYKRAMRNFLPRAIVDKTKHGFGLPFGVWTRAHDGLRRLSEDALGSLATRGIFRPEFLRSALEHHRQGHAAYHGELVWILMVLELWLRAKGGDARIAD